MSTGRRIPVYPHEAALGEVLKLDIQIKDHSGTVLPLDGYTARYALVNQRGEEVASYTPSIALDKISVRALIDGITPGIYTHALRIKSAVSDELVLFRGELRVLADLASF